mmetsp:Transcript_31364/g.103838  ORF Transcript_31364/g.103838 Transcript_31364/m.103838 type:complete len:214 (-) Transcript_31364:611-1252(-)
MRRGRRRCGSVTPAADLLRFGRCARRGSTGAGVSPLAGRGGESERRVRRGCGRRGCRRGGVGGAGVSRSVPPSGGERRLRDSARRARFGRRRHDRRRVSPAAGRIAARTSPAGRRGGSSQRRQAGRQTARADSPALRDRRAAARRARPSEGAARIWQGGGFGQAGAVQPRARPAVIARAGRGRPKPPSGLHPSGLQFRCLQCRQRLRPGGVAA